MEQDFDSVGPSTGRRHWILYSMSALGILSIVFFVALQKINKQGNEDIYLADAIMDIEVDIASSHFKLEESYHKHTPDAEERALLDIDHAIAQAKGLLDKGEGKSVPYLTTIMDSRLQAQAQSIVDQLFELKSISIQLSHAKKKEAFPWFLDERYDKVCDALLKNTKLLEATVQKKGNASRIKSNRLIYGMLFSWSCIVISAIFGLRNRELERRRAETRLLIVNADLKDRTEELSFHRERCMEMVEDRTASLNLANEGLRTEIRERQAVETALRKSEERYRMLIESMNEGLTILDQTERLVYVNDKFCEMLRYPRSRLLGSPLTEFIAFARDADVIQGYLRNIARWDHVSDEVAFKAGDGPTVYGIISLKAIQDADESELKCFAVITDITERVALQENSIRTAHLASLGEIAAGVAHDINNPITGIINYSQLLCDGPNTGVQVKDIGDRIRTEGRRIASIVKDLLLFGRSEIREKVPVYLNDVLSTALAITETGLRRDSIEIRLELEKDLPETMIDPQEMQRVFVNILSNSHKALNQKYPDSHENKILQIRSEMIHVDQVVYVRITFRDHGIGIPPQIINKVKQPFYSTRPKGKGTGLGLSISDVIISENKGKLMIESEEGEYTNVIIDLPGGSIQ